jgi:MSHA pilin protein MshA
MKKQKGFTLIEILIVVVILAVLAAMILPRFMSQSENAYIAEAQQVLGVLRRAQANSSDMGNGYKAKTVAETAADMNDLGLKGIAATNFTYSCDANGKCTALRSGAAANGSVALDINGTFTCDEVKYTLISASKGCKPKV